MNPSADLVFPGREWAAALLLCMKCTFTILQMATVSLCFGAPCEAPGSTLKGCWVLHKGSCSLDGGDPEPCMIPNALTGIEHFHFHQRLGMLDCH